MTTARSRRRASSARAFFIDPKRKLVIASNANWTRATKGPEPDAREAFYKQVQALVDAGK